MNYSTREERTKHVKTDRKHLHGAAIIDEFGKEIPITESMIRNALTKILEATQKSKI